MTLSAAGERKSPMPSSTLYGSGTRTWMVLRRNVAAVAGDLVRTALRREREASPAAVVVVEQPAAARLRARTRRCMTLTAMQSKKLKVPLFTRGPSHERVHTLGPRRVGRERTPHHCCKLDTSTFSYQYSPRTSFLL